MRLVVIADIHANLAAFEAVIPVIEKLRADLVVCLGDLVGYGAHAPECIARVQELADVVIAGNHDLDVATGSVATGTGAAARATQEWTRDCLNERELAYLGGLPTRHIDHDAGFLAVHGSFLNDEGVRGYVTSSMLELNLQRIAARDDWPKVALCGHTHVPLGGWIDSLGAHESNLREAMTWSSRASAVLVNPGSVGQPRDGDPRAAFALVDLTARTARVVRVPYDTQRSAAAIAGAGLPSELGERLHDGR